jgi:hypothetical protein
MKRTDGGRTGGHTAGKWAVLYDALNRELSLEDCNAFPKEEMKELQIDDATE